MYSTTQRNRDFLIRAGSHSTKGSSTRGVVGPDMKDWDFLPTVEELSLAELQDERVRLCDMRVKYPKGGANQQIAKRLSHVNKQIKRLNIENNERYQSRVLYLAMREVLDPLALEEVLAKAQQIRASGGD